MRQLSWNFKPANLDKLINLLRKGFLSMRKILILLFFALLSMCGIAQQQTFKTSDTSAKEENPEQRNWKDTHLISVPTTKTVDKHRMEFNLMHKLGNVGGASGGGSHTLYGFDIASDIYFNFDFGITRNLQVGIGRSKQKEMLDLDIKYRPLTQKKGGSPVSVAISEDFGVISQNNNTFYEAGDSTRHSIADRFVYNTQLIISRRFNRHISLELVPTLNFRNHVLTTMNTNKGVFDANAIPALGVGARYMFNGFVGIIADYYYIMSPYRVNNNVQSYYNAFSIGVEMHTGGHVFQINFSNTSAILPINLIPYTSDSWANGGFKLGFSISRLF